MYCSDECSKAARAESAREARDTYNARDTEAGRALHAAEEAARRERRAREKQGTAKGEEPADGSRGAVAARPAEVEPSPAASAGAAASVEALGTATAARIAEAREPRGVASTSWRAAGEMGPMGGPLVRVGDQRCAWQPDGLLMPSPTASPAEAEARDAPSSTPSPVAEPPLLALDEREPVEWILVVPSELLRAARRRAGTVAMCPFCGRWGRVGRVVSTEQWQRWIRRGLDPPA